MPISRRAALVGAILATGLAPAAFAQTVDHNALVEAARKEGKVVIYTTGQQDLTARIMAEFKKKYPFLDVSEFYRNSAGRIYARLQAEIDAKQPTADVFASSSIATFLELKAGKRLAQFVTPEQKAYPATYQDPGYWTVWQAQPLLLAYDESKLAPADRPDSWQALMDPKFRGKVGFEDATSGTQFTQWALLRQALGNNFWAKLRDNQPKTYPGTTPIIEGVLRGELALGADIGSYQFVNYGKQGAPLKAIYPKEGVPVSLLPIAVLADAPHPAAGRLLVDWLLSAEGQRVVVDIIGNYSPREDVAAPSGAPAYAGLKKILPDSFEKFVAAQDDFVDEWKRLTAAR